MRAVRFNGQDVYLDTQSPEPDPAPGEAVVRPTVLGIGNSDLGVVRGMVSFQGIIGHQFVGVVESVNSADGTGIDLAGKRVVAGINIVDPNSEYARRGLPMHEPSRRVIGLHNADGCFAERIVLPVRNLAVVPDHLSDEAAVFAGPMASAIHAAQRVPVEGKTFVTVLGDNTSALLCAQIMARRNASVRLLGNNPRRYELCEKWGIKHRAMTDAGLHDDQDIVFECTGDAGSILRALRMTRPRGTVVLKASPIPLPPEERSDAPSAGSGEYMAPVILQELAVLGSRCGRIQDGLAALAAGEADVSALITRRFRFEDVVAALRAATEPDQIKVLIDAA